MKNIISQNPNYILIKKNTINKIISSCTNYFIDGYLIKHILSFLTCINILPAYTNDYILLPNFIFTSKIFLKCWFDLKCKYCIIGIYKLRKYKQKNRLVCNSCCHVFRSQSTISSNKFILCVK
jgi:hypothetical protein